MFTFRLTRKYISYIFNKQYGILGTNFNIPPGLVVDFYTNEYVGKRIGKWSLDNLYALWMHFLCLIIMFIDVVVKNQREPFTNHEVSIQLILNYKDINVYM